MATGERELLLRAMVKASPDLVLIFDEDGEVDADLGNFTERLGYTDVSVAFMISVVHPDDVAVTREAFRRLVTLGDQGLSVRFRLRHALGHWVAVEARGRPIRTDGGDRIGSVVLCRDVTNQVVLEDLLRESRDDAEAANRAKNEFLSRMSHELRTPLNAILGFGQLLDLEDLDHESRDSVDHILRGGRHLLALIDDVLDIARIETGRVELTCEPVSLRSLSEDTLALVGATSAGSEITLAIDDQPGDIFVLADRQRLVQVVLNLVTNAAKYNHPGGSVTVSWKAVADGLVRVSIVDTGWGIATDDLGRIFEPFVRAVPSHLVIDGNGVGLALARQLLVLMGGSIGVESTLGTGSTFWFELPAAEGPQRLGTLPTRRVGGRVDDRPLLVLQIEDTPANQALITRALQRDGETEVISTSLGAPATALAEQHQPDVILLDLHLPDIEGAEVLASLRANPATREIPVIVVSADATSARIAQLEALGAAAYLTKPVDLRQLRAALRVVCP